MSPLVTVIIPCYNYGQYLPETLDSILSQSLTNWECIIVDDGSTDNTKIVATEYVKKDNRFQYIYQENQGVSAARNNAIIKAKGRYIQFLDGDDLITTEKIFLHTNILNNNPEIDIVYSPPTYFYSDSPEITLHCEKMGIETLKKTGTGLDILSSLIKHNQITTLAPLIRKNVAEQYFREDLNWHEDWDFWLRCCFSNYYYYYSDTVNLIKIRLHKQRINLSSNTLQMKITSVKIRKELNSKLQNRLHIKENEIYLQTDHIILGLHYKNNSLFWKGQKELWNAFVLLADIKRTCFAFLSLFVSGKVGSALLKYVTGQ